MRRCLKQNKKNKQQGVVLVVVLLFLQIFMLLGISALLISDLSFKAEYFRWLNEVNGAK
jgi:hypothetical protein